MISVLETREKLSVVNKIPKHRMLKIINRILFVNVAFENYLFLMWKKIYITQNVLFQPILSARLSGMKGIHIMCNNKHYSYPEISSSCSTEI